LKDLQELFRASFAFAMALTVREIEEARVWLIDRFISQLKILQNTGCDTLAEAELFFKAN
jgi:hypothetical protein